VLLSSIKRPARFELWSEPNVTYIIDEQGSIVNEKTGEVVTFPGDYIVYLKPRKPRKPRTPK